MPDETRRDDRAHGPSGPPAPIPASAPAEGSISAAPDDGGDQEILRRLKSVEGHVRGIQRMVARDAYCIDVVHQVSAVRKALHEVSARVLDAHLRTCVTTAIRGESPDERERVIGEILDVFQADGR
jgi:DNA-binding FrmR family transcriptional regulator